jgi:hypothetical protein
VDANDTNKKIVGTNINVSSLLDPNENAMWFKWVQVDRPGAEEYVKGYVKYYADMGISDIARYQPARPDKGRNIHAQGGLRQ